jgi:precorrin-6B methylase 2
MPTCIKIPLLARLRFKDVIKVEGKVVKMVASKFKLKTGWTFVDVGAYVGFYTVLASKQVGKDGTVIAIEPRARAFNPITISLVPSGYMVALAPKKTFRFIKVACSANFQG